MRASPKTNHIRGGRLRNRKQPPQNGQAPRAPQRRMNIKFKPIERSEGIKVLPKVYNQRFYAFGPKFQPPPRLGTEQSLARPFIDDSSGPIHVELLGHSIGSPEANTPAAAANLALTRPSGAVVGGMATGYSVQRIAEGETPGPMPLSGIGSGEVAVAETTDVPQSYVSGSRVSGLSAGSVGGMMARITSSAGGSGGHSQSSEAGGASYASVLKAVPAADASYLSNLSSSTSESGAAGIDSQEAPKEGGDLDDSTAPWQSSPRWRSRAGLNPLGGRRRAFHRSSGPGGDTLPIYLEGEGSTDDEPVNEGGWEGAKLDEVRGDEANGLKNPALKFYILAQIEPEGATHLQELSNKFVQAMVDQNEHFKPGQDIQAYPDLLETASQIKGVKKTRLFIGSHHPAKLDRLVVGSQEQPVCDPARVEIQFGYFQDHAFEHNKDSAGRLK